MHLVTYFNLNKDKTLKAKAKTNKKA